MMWATYVDFMLVQTNVLWFPFFPLSSLVTKTMWPLLALEAWLQAKHVRVWNMHSLQAHSTGGSQLCCPPAEQETQTLLASLSFFHL